LKSKTLGLALILVAIVFVAPATYVVATSNSNGSLYGMMGGGMMDDTDVDYMMGDTEHLEDEDWWDEMKEHMEDHMNEVEDEDWWDEMKEHMDDHMDI
jgi:hypothetical protein